MNWAQAQSLDDLKKLGKLKDVAIFISEELMSPKVPKNSWNNLWQYIVSYQDKMSVEVATPEKISFKEVTSVEELKKLGTFKEIKEQVSKALAPRKIRAKSWSELYDVLKLSSKANKENDEEKVYNSLYFKDASSEVIFYLLELEGEARLKKLGITNWHYKDKEQANNWKKQLIKLIHPDQSTHPKAEEATKELNKLYGSMIKFGE